MLRLSALMACAVVGLAGWAGAANPPVDGLPNDLAELQGYWKPLSVEFESKPQMTAAELKKITVVFDQSEYHLYFKDTSKNPGAEAIRLALMNVSLDSSTNPKSIVFEFAAGALKGQKRHGIYEVAGNQLKLCYGPIEKPKPTQFAAPPGSGLFLEVWAKQPPRQ